MPMSSVLLTIPAMPTIYTGQEVGWGSPLSAINPGEPDLNVRRRGIVDWNFFGRRLLMPHYQRLGNIRGQFAAFWSQTITRLSVSDGNVYAFTRPFTDRNGLTVANFGTASTTVTLDLTQTGAVNFTGGIQTGTTYFINNLMDNTRIAVQGSALNAVQVTLPAFGSGVYTVSRTQDSLTINFPVMSAPTTQNTNAKPKIFGLEQNYPNPFNPTTGIRYQVAGASDVRLEVFDMLGRKVATLVNERQSAGAYSVNFNATSLASGVYFYRLQAGSFVETKKMMLVK
jgi:hypothetical protein